jgi:hypothetical protein
MQIWVAPIGWVRFRFVVAGLLAKRVLILAERQIVGLPRIDLSKAAVFVSVGHWLHDTPPIFQIG